MDTQKEGRLKASVRSYLLLNVIVWIYSLGMLFVSKAILRDITGLGFISVILPVGFAIVSIFDFLFDRFAGTSEEPDQQ